MEDQAQVRCMATGPEALLGLAFSVPDEDLEHNCLKILLLIASLFKVRCRVSF